MHMLKIAHIITDMNGFGGTEATLLRYIKASKIPISCHRVIVLKSLGVGTTLGAQMVAAGISVIALDQKRSSISIIAVFRLYKELKKFDPDLISGWLYHPSLLASFIAPFLRRRPAVVWNIRSLPFANLLKTPGRFIVQRVLAALSYFTRPILVSNSSAAMREHVAIGFKVSKSHLAIINNGIDSHQYFPHSEDRLTVRRELNIPTDALLIGCVGRFVPEKGYQIMFDALRLTQEKLRPELFSRLHFLAVGNNVTLENQAFRELVLSSIPENKIHLLGKRADVARLLRSLDLFILSSISESFPNSLVEAMATGIACISTDVGECSEVLFTPDLVVPSSDAFVLSERIVKVLEMTEVDRGELGATNRKRIVEQYGLSKMIESFDSMFKNAINMRTDDAQKQ
jgi:glycosyltransferase involved in cell wall biosynthesis